MEPATEALTDELMKLDALEQRLFQEKAQEGKHFDQIYDEVRAETRPLFLQIILRHKDAPIYPVRFPNPHPSSDPTAEHGRSVGTPPPEVG